MTESSVLMMGAVPLGDSSKIIAINCLVLARLIGNTKKREALMKPDNFVNPKAVI